MPNSRGTIPISLPVIRGIVLGVKVYRGYAKLSDLARISKADIFDKNQNPMGTQRGLNRKHARRAYDYVAKDDLAFWPEVFLCARNPDAIKYIPLKKNAQFGTITINQALIDTLNQIAISRVDGNHRLHFADGSDPKMPAIDKEVSFCLAYDLDLQQELVLFKDINDNQRRMDTSHLDNIQVRLTPRKILKQQSPELYIAKKLGSDEKSPLRGRIYEGGKKSSSIDIPLRALKTGIRFMFSKSAELPPLQDADAQYRVIRNYFLAVKKWQAKAWAKPRAHIILRGAGLWAICFIGAIVIDRSLARGKFATDDMVKVLKSGKNWDWSNAGPFKGYSGRGGALEISNTVTRELFDESRPSTKDLFKRIMQEEN